MFCGLVRPGLVCNTERSYLLSDLGRSRRSDGSTAVRASLCRNRYLVPNGTTPRLDPAYLCRGLCQHHLCTAGTVAGDNLWLAQRINLFGAAFGGDHYSAPCLHFASASSRFRVTFRWSGSDLKE